MNLDKLFETQRFLDTEIEKKHPVQPGEDRLAKRILALQVELGECANEWRGFKFWSTDQKPRYEKGHSNGVNGEWGVTYPLLEEYVDCLHFILSIGIEMDLENTFVFPMKSNDKITYTFSRLMCNAHWLLDKHEEGESIEASYGSLFSVFVGLGELLGFSWEQIEAAYMSKNKINHERQANGY